MTSAAGRIPTRERADRDGNRGDITEIQRMRIIAALAEVARARGVAAATVSEITTGSGVSRRTFYELFAGREDCFRAAFDQAVAQAAQHVVPAFRAGRTWRERMRGALAALLEFLEDEPDLGALCVVDALGAGHEALARRAEVIDVLIAAVEEGGAEMRGAPAARMTAEGVVGAVLAVLHARLVQAQAPPMTGLLGSLMAIVVLPYLGRAAAARELSRPSLPRRRHDHAGGNPLRDLDLRLTYRTVRTLSAIAAHPGANNRQIGDVAGVGDQGQISKLLARLEHAGLVCNVARGSGTRGEPNAWTLTDRGRDVEHVIGERVATDDSRA